MAQSKNNVVTHGLSGLVGDMLVFSNRHGKTFVSSKPKERTGELSQKQLENKAKFQEAILYAKTAIRNEAINEVYKKEAVDGASTYNIAVADFFKAPNINEIDVRGYMGKIGDKISIQVIDITVEEVTVTIQNPDGTEVEHGNATYSELTGKWEFTAKANNASLDGDKIIVTATDMPGNIGLQEKTIV